MLSELLLRMKSPIEAERRDAARGVASLGPEAAAALDPLLECLHDQAWSVRAAAVESLCRLATAGAGLAWIDRLLAILRHPDARVRNSAVTVLSRIGPTAIPVLAGAFAMPDPDTARYAADALGELGDRHAVLPLVAALGHPSDDVKYYAMVALGKLRDAEAVAPLLELTGDADEDVREAAVEAVGRLTGDAVLGALVAALGDESWKVRTAAATALGRRAETAAQDALAALLDDPHPSARRAAEVALERTGAPR